MDPSISETQSEFNTSLGAVRPGVDPVTHCAIDATRPSLRSRVLGGLVRFLIIFAVGVSTILAWQSYGDAARAMIASSSPQLGWLAPQTVNVVQITPDAVPSVATVTPSPELQELTLRLASMRQSLDLLAAQVAAGQQQMAMDIAKLQAQEQEILRKLTVALSRPASAPVHKPAPATTPSAPSAHAPVASPSSPSAQAR
jgi:hypothetical protein